MKKYVSLLITVLILASCSSPKYTYNFDYFDYNSGKKKATPQKGVTVQQSVLTIDEETLVASAKETEVYIAKPAPVISKAEAIAKIKSLSKEERKELKEERKELKREVKKLVKERKLDNAVYGSGTKALENDVKLAAIFGAVGIVLLIIGGSVIYVLGAISLLIGLYFFIRYLSRQ